MSEYYNEAEIVGHALRGDLDLNLAIKTLRERLSMVMTSSGKLRIEHAVTILEREKEKTQG